MLENSFEGRDSPEGLSGVPGAGRDCSAPAPCQKMGLGEGMYVLVCKQLV